jgi:hypothetical protein
VAIRELPELPFRQPLPTDKFVGKRGGFPCLGQNLFRARQLFIGEKTTFAERGDECAVSGRHAITEDSESRSRMARESQNLEFSISKRPRLFGAVPLNDHKLPMR